MHSVYSLKPLRNSEPDRLERPYRASENTCETIHFGRMKCRVV